MSRFVYDSNIQFTVDLLLNFNEQESENYILFLKTQTNNWLSD